MRSREGSERTTLMYNVRDQELSQQIEKLLKELEPYSSLDLIREVLVTGVKLAEEKCSRGDLKILRSAIKELRYAFKIFSLHRHQPKVSMFGSARLLPTAPEYQTAMKFARRMAEAGYLVITGAGGGIMAAGNEGAGRKMSFGLNILLPFEQVANEAIADDPKLINFRYFFTRKLFFVKESDGVVLLPGGFGTQDEGFETLTLVQTGRSDPKPIIMLDAPGGSYWKDWYQFVSKQMLERGLISPEDDHLFLVTDDVDRACQEMETFYKRYHSLRYVEHKKMLVLRLKEPLKPEWVERLSQDFHDIVVDGEIEISQAFQEESDEPDLLDLPRLSLPFNRRNLGRLRQLINAINTF